MNFKNLNFKNLLIVTLLFVTGFIYAQTECKTIAELRKQQNGTEVLYTGTATTTFYGPGGILIQDETGYIYVRNGLLSEWGSSKVRTNMKISEIFGKFRTATNEEMTQIDVEFNEDVQYIKIKEQNASFNITDVALNDFLANPMSYECQPIRLTDVEVTDVDGSKFIGSGENKVRLVSDYTLPARGTFEGYYGNNFTQGFIIPEQKYITASAYKTIHDIKHANRTDSTLGILNPVLVNRVVKNNDNTTTLYVQEDYGYWGTYGTTVIVENLVADVKEGDSIVGIRGYVTPFTVVNETEVYGSRIEQKGDLGANIQIVNSNNILNSSRIQELEYVKGEAAINFEATLCSTPVGTIKYFENKYALEVVNSNTNLLDTILIAGTDFTDFIGTKHALIGVVDAGIVNPGYITLVLRSTKDILLDNYQFNTIAEMRAAGRPLATDVTYELINPVLVTYKQEYSIDDVDLIGVHIQDATGGYFVKKQITDTEKFEINVGDSVINFKGTFVNTAGTGYMLDFSDIHNTQEDPYEIISSNNPVDKDPINVTIAELAADPHKYSSRVIRLTNVMKGDTTYNAWWTEGMPRTDYYLYQEGSPERMFYSWNYPLYEKNNIVGIFDDACYAEEFTIIPLSAAHITDAEPIENPDDTPVENINNNNVNIAYNNNTLFLSSIVDTIEIYNTNGVLIIQQNVYSKTLPINLEKGIYIIRLYDRNGEIITNKIAIK